VNSKTKKKLATALIECLLGVIFVVWGLLRLSGREDSYDYALTVLLGIVLLIAAMPVLRSFKKDD
jgi:hypothetical protein